MRGHNKCFVEEQGKLSLSYLQYSLLYGALHGRSKLFLSLGKDSTGEEYPHSEKSMKSRKSSPSPFMKRRENIEVLFSILRYVFHRHRQESRFMCNFDRPDNIDQNLNMHV